MCRMMVACNVKSKGDLAMSWDEGIRKAKRKGRVEDIITITFYSKQT